MAVLIMKGILWFFCLFIIAFGVLFSFFPKTVVRMNEWGNRVLFSKADAVARHVAVGTTLLILGAIILFILFRI